MWKSAASKKEAITKVYEDIKEREKDEGGKINRGVRAGRREENTE